MRRKTLVRALPALTFLALLAVCVQGQPSWHPLDGSPPGSAPTVEITSFATETTTLRVTVHGFWEEDISTAGLTFKKILLPSADATSAALATFHQGVGESGKSDLPVVRVTIGLLSNASTVSVTNIGYSGPEFLDSHRIYPYQGDLITGYGPSWAFDTSHYASTDVYPYDAITPPYSDMQYPVMDSHNLRLVTIPVPVFFVIPSYQALSALRQTTVTLSHVGAAYPIHYLSRTWRSVWEGSVANIGSFPQPIVVANKQLLIYVKDAYSTNTAFLGFVKWKRQQKFDLTVKKVPGDVAATTSAISADIGNFNSTYVCNDIFVLFVGDKADIPTLVHTYKYKDTANCGYAPGQLENADSDYKYACQGGANDLYADLFYGRISVDDNTDVTNIFNKILAYEKNPPSGAWPQSAVLAAHRDGGNFTNFKDKIAGFNYSISTPPAFTKRYGTQASGTKANLLNDLNTTHCGILNYDGHGANAPSNWWQWDWNSASLSIADVTGLANGSYTPLVVAICCWNGNVAQEDCIGEEWLETAGNGAVGHIGFSREEYIISGSEFDVLFFKKVFDKGVYEVGPALVAAHNENVTNYEALVKQGVWSDQYGEINAFRCILLGDPTMLVRTEATKDFDPATIDVNPVIAGSQNRTVTVKDNGTAVEDATVCLEKGVEVFVVGTTNASGQVTLTLNPITPGSLWATVSKHNYTVWEGNPAAEATPTPTPTATGSPGPTATPTPTPNPNTGVAGWEIYRE